MRITDIKTYIVYCPLGDRLFWSSQRPFHSRNSLLVQVLTDEGIDGWGESGQFGPPEPVAAMIEHVLKPILVNKNPLDLNVLWETMYQETRDYGRKSTPIEAISGIDIALWDIVGKSLQLPIWQLLGGAFRTRIVAYATGLYYRGETPTRVDAAALREESQLYIEEGFKAIKMKIGLLPLKDDLNRVEIVRDSIGDNTLLMVDANHAYNTHTAMKISEGLKQYNVLWFEEPVLPENIEGYVALRRAGTIPIAGGECEYTRYGFRTLFQQGALDIAQPDTCCAGGISEMRNIIALATTYGVMCLPHNWGSAIALAANLHLLACLPPCPPTAHPVLGANEPMLEYDRNPNPLRDELATERISLHEGYVNVPQQPGLGVTVNLDFLNFLIKKDLARQANSWS